MQGQTISFLRGESSSPKWECRELDKEVNVEKQDYTIIRQEALARIHQYYVMAILIEISREVLRMSTHGDA
eukprot:3013960-Ditylum_brightwellii.AAC.1